MPRISDIHASPAEGRSLKRRSPAGLSWNGVAWNFGIIAALVILWFASAICDQYILASVMDLLIRIGISITLAVSLNLINGITGQFSLGHAAFMAVGGYAAGTIMQHYQPTGWVLPLMFVGVTILGGLLAALGGLFVGIPALRLRGDYLAVATLAFGEITTRVLGQIDHIGPFRIGGAAGLHGIPVVTNLFWAYAWATVCLVFIWRLVRSGKGKPFLSIREDEIAAGAMGVNTTFYKVAAFVIGAFFAGVAGSLTAMFVGNLKAADLGFMRSVEIVVMVVLGGSGSLTGSVIAAIILTWLPEQLRFSNELRMVVYALLLIVMMLVRPEGLLGKREFGWKRRRPARDQILSTPSASI